MKLMKIFMALTAMAVILVSCGEKPDPEPIVKKDPSIKISPLDIPAMNAAGGSVNISVTANMDWVVTRLYNLHMKSPQMSLQRRFLHL